MIEKNTIGIHEATMQNTGRDQTRRKLDMGFLNKIKANFARFMSGRYGADQLARFLSFSLIRALHFCAI